MSAETTRNFDVVSLPYSESEDAKRRERERFVELLVCNELRRHSVPHGFTLRSGGFGARVNGRQHERSLARALGQTGFVRMNQVHGSSVRSLDAAPPEPPTCDGLTTSSPGLGLVVASADCVPLLFWDERTNAVAAVHAGWRGTLANAAAAAVAELESARGVKAQELRVAMGPAIRACCFEVGEEVVAAFDGSGRDMRRIVRTGASPTGRTHLDLIEDNRIQLREAGIPDDRIYDSNRCTVCDNERFYSFRKEGEGVGRVLGMIAPRPNRS